MTTSIGPRAAARSAANPPIAMAIALAGCGRWGRNILRDLLSLGAAVFVADPDETIRRAATAAGASASVASVDLLPAVAGAIVASPATTHEAVVTALLSRGVPVFCEKPLTADGAGAFRLAALGGTRLFVMDKWRYHPAIEALGAIARSGELGVPLRLETKRLQPGHDHGDVNGIWTLAPHDLSIALEILGGIPAPVGATGERTNGNATTLRARLGTMPEFEMEVSVTSSARLREVRLTCEHGVALFRDDAEDRLLVFREGLAEPETRAVSSEPPLRRELAVFLAHLSGGAPPKSDAAAGASAVETLETLLRMAGLAADQPA